MEKNTYNEHEIKVIKPFTDGLTQQNLKGFIDGIQGIKNDYKTDLSVEFIYSLIGGKSSVNRVNMSRVLKQTQAKLTEVKRTFKVRTLSHIAKTNETFKFISFN